MLCGYVRCEHEEKLGEDYMGTLPYLCNFPVNLHLFQKKKKNT